MKTLKFACIALFFSLTVISCKKDSDVIKTNDSFLHGIWAGKFGTGNNTPSSFFGFNIKANGSIEELDPSGKAIGTGSWKYENNIFTASWQYEAPSTAKFSAVATYNTSIQKLLGNWGYNTSTTNGGSWEMSKN